MSVFISHSLKDLGPYSSLSLALEGKGIKFWDPKKMRAGSSLKDQLRRAINDCEVCIFLATKNSVNSGWCLAEVGAFWGAGVNVIIFLSDPELTEDQIPPQFKGDLWTRDVREVIISIEDDIRTSTKFKINYGIKILLPENGAIVGNPIEISGTYEISPPDRLFRVLEFDPFNHEYWPKQYINFDETNKTWFTKVSIGGAIGEKRVLKIASIGENGRILLEYSKRVVDKTQKWPGIHALTSDIEFCDNVTIVKAVDS